MIVPALIAAGCGPQTLETDEGPGRLPVHADGPDGLMALEGGHQHNYGVAGLEHLMLRNIVCVEACAERGNVIDAGMFARGLMWPPDAQSRTPVVMLTGAHAETISGHVHSAFQQGVALCVWSTQLPPSIHLFCCDLSCRSHGKSALLCLCSMSLRAPLICSDTQGERSRRAVLCVPPAHQHKPLPQVPLNPILAEGFLTIHACSMVLTTMQS